MERLTWVDEDGTVLFQQPNQFPEDVAYTITELARNEEYDFLVMIAERLANREVAADYYKLKYEKKCAELAAERQKHGWIPVDERLPDKYMEVLVAFEDGFGGVVAWYSEMDKIWWNANTERPIDAKIIAWQPLPEPYQPEKGGAIHET